ncbi:helix-turn-helix transcriptional regulator [Ralstonia pseudosolanacearum]|uniref:helix-turn-helix transcriptional regulator n=1 Tax=Ralstonia pseudosolanacearum TaxID=1310165 RepID=UPI00267596F8|nr:helix-turn-helix transcriptional regulator [Ralstonia pseudosolanacearum]MDO3622827.1 helix-turn-helix transcriptional regulator [Ralstonia pseudosolanacearum]
MPDDLALLFASELRRRREAMGLSQQALGDRVGLDRNSISRIERGAPNLSLHSAEEIAHALETNLSSMLGSESRSRLNMTNAFGSKVRELRTERGWNQRELAERVGVDRNWVSVVEAGKSISLRTLQKFASALGVTPTDLLS